jgi:hypothetical protein
MLGESRSKRGRPEKSSSGLSCGVWWVIGVSVVRRGPCRRWLPAPETKPSFYKVAIGVPRCVPEQRHEDDQAEEQGEKAQCGQGDDGRAPASIGTRLASTARRLVRMAVPKLAGRSSSRGTETTVRKRPAAPDSPDENPDQQQVAVLDRQVDLGQQGQQVGSDSGRQEAKSSVEMRSQARPKNRQQQPSLASSMALRRPPASEPMKVDFWPFSNRRLIS